MPVAEWAAYGNPYDLWGTTWTPQDVNSPTFGAFVSALNTDSVASDVAKLDDVQLTVFYELATGIEQAAANAEIIFDPINGLLSVQNIYSPYTLTLFSLEGKKVFETHDTIRREFQLNCLHSGVYLAALTSESGLLKKKIIIY